MPAEHRRPLRLAGTLLAGALLVTGCSEDTSPGSDPVTSERSGAPRSGIGTYVALGDSFTAAPFVPTTDLAEGCFRSDGNYPSLLAEQLEPERFVDVSCGAATTADVTRSQTTVDGRGQVPPQLRAVRRDADLVTIGIGANDEDFFAAVATTCVTADASGLCTEAFLRRSRAALPRTGDRVAAVLQRVQRRAPEATVVLVGYPRLADPEQSCARIPVPTARLADIAELERRLNRALGRAARRAGALFADLRPDSRGHEVCSSDPWVNGVRTDEQAALALHPFAAGQEAAASEVLEVLEEEGRL